MGVLLGILAGGCERPALENTRPDPNAPVEVVIPEHGAYTGAFMDFGDEEDDVTLEMIEDFEGMVGKHQAIIASSSYWGEQRFPADNLNVIWRHGSLPLVFWSPWDKFKRDYCWDVGWVHRQVGRRGPRFWSSVNCRIRCRNERDLVPVVRGLLWQA